MQHSLTIMIAVHACMMNIGVGVVVHKYDTYSIYTLLQVCTCMYTYLCNSSLLIFAS